MVNETCAVDGCDRPLYGHGKCNMHWLRFRRHGTTDKPVRVSRAKTCAADGCEKPVNARGLCLLHYQRARVAGDELGPDRSGNMLKVVPCAVAKCDRHAFRLGLCHAHYVRDYRRAKNGSVPRVADNAAIRKTAKRREGRSINTDGYVIVFGHGHPNSYPSGNISEHRLNMALHLGRALTPNENVHHRSHDKADNSVGPCAMRRECDCVGARHNLELWSTSQPKGQRVADKIAWCRAFLAQYDSQP